MSARRQRGRRQDRRASADCAPIPSPRGESGHGRLCCAADVAVVESADLGQCNDAPLRGWLDGARLGSILLEREMRARAVVVADVAVQTATEVSLIQDDHVVEELAADGADHAFDEGILPWRTGRRENLGDAHAVHPSPKLAAVDAVAIAEERSEERRGERV